MTDPASIAVEIPLAQDDALELDAQIPKLPFEKRLDIAIDHVEYSVPIVIKKKLVGKPVLRGVSCVFPAGKLTAILGASGAGKTSLLNVIAGEVKKGSIQGKMLLNGQPSTGAEIKRVSAFVQQDDVILGTMTVREAIFMSARLRLPESLTDAEREAKVDETIAMLGLGACQGNAIGSVGQKSISGGERKRVALAMELITNPACIFADEPTSGLDAASAHSVVEVLHDLAASGRTTVCTIHQPSSEVFALFDNLLLLADGQVMYYGPAADSVSYFTRAGYPVPQFSNPADYFFYAILNTSKKMRTITAPAAGAAAAARHDGPYAPGERIHRLLEVWARSPECATVADRVMNPTRSDGITKDSFKYRSGFVTQMQVLLPRAAKNAFRNPLMVRTKLAQTLFLHVLLGLIYLNVPSRGFSSQTQDRSGVLFFIPVQQVMSNAIGTLSVFTSEKNVFEREHGAGYYSLPAFFFSKLLVELPFQVIFPVLGTAILYPMVGLQGSFWKFCIAAAFAVASALSGTAIGTLASCAFDELSVSLAIVPLAMIPLNVPLFLFSMIFSGLFVNTGDMAAYLDWIKWISPMHYGFTGLVKNEFDGLTICPKTTDPLPIQKAGCIPGSAVITQLGLDNQGDTLMNFLVLIALWAVLLVLSFLALWRLVRSAKRADFEGTKKGGVSKNGSVEAPVSVVIA
ncbi:P-loop containing nucleoside triphosphate hydrolase protein [Blastocladiella britannica]|nr:P-loop containing nucleoside triphosphate hydrolase protein [Blastocladiella britannica]